MAELLAHFLAQVKVFATTQCWIQALVIAAYIPESVLPDGDTSTSSIYFGLEPTAEHDLCRGEDNALR